MRANIQLNKWKNKIIASKDKYCQENKIELLESYEWLEKAWECSIWQKTSTTSHLENESRAEAKPEGGTMFEYN